LNRPPLHGSLVDRRGAWVLALPGGFAAQRAALVPVPDGDGRARASKPLDLVTEPTNQQG
jgi:hypothetical protein